MGVRHVSALLLFVLVALAPTAGSAATVARLAGSERIATAVAVSTNQWDDGAASVVVLARADVAADALAATPLAADWGPILLTSSTELSPATEREIQRVLDPESPVALVGGPAAIGEQVEDRLEELGYIPVRVAGETRFETALMIADMVDPSPVRIVVADGRGFADALLAGTYAVRIGGAVLVLSDGRRLPDSVAAYLQEHTRAEVTTVGIDASEAARDYADLSYVGDDVYDLSTRLAATSAYAGATVVGIASGEDFPDALSGGAWTATAGAPLLLVRRDQAPASVTAFVRDLDPAQVVVFGGPAAINDHVIGQITGPASASVDLTTQGVQDHIFELQAADLPDVLIAALGQPTSDTGWYPEPCTGGSAVRDYRWGVVQVTFRSGGDGNDIRLGGWLLGDYSTIPSGPVPGQITTPSNIDFETTWAQLRELGATFDPDYGFWELPNGLRGELDGDSGGYFSPPDSARVSALGAGYSFFAGC